MKLTIRSSSAVITRNLQAIAERSGITLSLEADADLTLLHSADSLIIHRGETVTPLACPLHPRALIAALHTAASATPTTLQPLAHGWGFEPVLRNVSGHQETIALTEKESLLLAALLSATPHAISRDALLKEVWSFEPDIETHTLETHIYRLRQKLEALTPPPCIIETIDGAYRLMLPLTA